MRIASIIIWTLCAVIPAPARAQISYPADSTVAYAQAEGREAADGDYRGDLTLLAIAGGTLLGTFGWHLAGSENREGIMLAALGGILLVGSTQGSVDVPETEAARIRNWPAAQQEAFRKAYAQRKSDRRMSNAAVGLAVGAVIGLIVIMPQQR